MGQEKPIIIFANNWRQAKIYARKSGVKNYMHVARREQLAGLSGHKIIKLRGHTQSEFWRSTPFDLIRIFESRAAEIVTADF